MNKIIAVVLIVVAVFLGYIGINKIADSTKSVNILGIELKASDNSGKTEGIMYVVFAAVLLGGGLYSLNRKG